MPRPDICGFHGRMTRRAIATRVGRVQITRSTIAVMGAFALLLLPTTPALTDWTTASRFTVSVALAATGARTWRQTGRPHLSRNLPSITLLTNGKVLLAGGLNSADNTPLDSAELYEPSSGTWSLTTRMPVAKGNPL